MSDKIIIFDTTLRDGEQSPGASMTKDEKVRIARQLERLKVDVIEAGFAASSEGDFQAISAVAAVVKDSIVCSLARANDKDITRAADALKNANAKRIHAFLATSPLHMAVKLRYKTLNQRAEILAGSGKTLNISSSGVLFTSDHDLPVGTRLEVSISWPAQLNEKCLLNLVARGRVTRHNKGTLALQIQQYEFRTQSRSGK